MNALRKYWSLLVLAACIAAALAFRRFVFVAWYPVLMSGAVAGGFALSLCVECLQWVLRVGFFELTDLVLNTLGACAGALLTAAVRSSRSREETIVSLSFCSISARVMIRLR